MKDELSEVKAQLLEEKRRSAFLFGEALDSRIELVEARRELRKLSSDFMAAVNASVKVLTDERVEKLKAKCDKLFGMVESAQQERDVALEELQLVRKTNAGGNA